MYGNEGDKPHEILGFCCFSWGLWCGNV